MNDIQNEEITNIINGFSEEEKKLFLTLMPDDILWFELRRRFDESKDKLDRVKDVFHSPQD